MKAGWFSNYVAMHPLPGEIHDTCLPALLTVAQGHRSTAVYRSLADRFYFDCTPDSEFILRAKAQSRVCSVAGFASSSISREIELEANRIRPVTESPMSLVNTTILPFHILLIKGALDASPWRGSLGQRMHVGMGLETCLWMRSDCELR